jgi:thiazole synthase ThiGH ThiG subunit
VAEVVVVDGGIGYVAEVVEVDEEFGCTAEVVVVDWHRADAAFAHAEALAYALATEGYQRCTTALQALLTLYLCAASELQHAGLLPASS